jgi:hypothetical protein
MVLLVAGENVSHERALTGEKGYCNVKSLGMPKLRLSLSQHRIHTIIVILHLKQKS